MIKISPEALSDVITDVLADHPHKYDSDCRADFGCACGSGSDDIDIELEAGRARHAEHLRDVLTTAIEAAQQPDVLDSAVARVRLAWVDEGHGQTLHKRAQRLLRSDWPALATAVDDLARLTS